MNFFKYYKTNKKATDKEEELRTIIEQLRLRVEKQDELLETLQHKEKKKAKQSTPQSSKYLANFFQPQEYNDVSPKSESVKSEIEETEEDNIPDYDNMNDEEKERYILLFETNFELLKKSYPSLILSIPRVRELSLRTVHEIYCDLVNTILIYQTAMKLKVVVIAGCAALEYFGNRKYKIKVLKNITKIQIKRIDKYVPFFVDLARSICSKLAGEYPYWVKFVVNIGLSLLSFISIQAVSIGLGFGCADDDILKEADRFVSPQDGKFRFKDDGIPDVPPVPTGFQDPDDILRRLPGLIDLVNPDGADPVAAQEPVREKEQKNNYDEVY